MAEGGRRVKGWRASTIARCLPYSKRGKEFLHDVGSRELGLNVLRCNLLYAHDSKLFNVSANVDFYTGDTHRCRQRIRRTRRTRKHPRITNIGRTLQRQKRHLIPIGVGEER
jgi:hypothetical protein